MHRPCFLFDTFHYSLPTLLHPRSLYTSTISGNANIVLPRTWAGQSFETSSGVPSGQVIEEPFDGTNVTVAASEVVMITFC